MINVVLIDLPCSIRGFTKKVSGGYTIVLNAKLNREQNEKTLKHELDHIENDDLFRDLDIQEVEYLAHSL
jgi:hypothetical protein